MRKLVVIFLCALFATQIHARNVENAKNGTTRNAGNKFQITNKENEALRAIIAFSVVDPEDVSIILQAVAGSTKARANEIYKILQATKDSTIIPVTEESKAQAKELIELAHAALDAKKKHADMVAIQNSSSASMTIEGHQLGPALIKAGMLPDINRATNALKSKMDSAAYRQLYADAYHQIDKSASQLLMGGDRDALAGYLMLQAEDPVAAAEILYKTLASTSNGFNR